MLCIFYRYYWSVGSSPEEANVVGNIVYDHWHRKGCYNVGLNHSEKYYSTILAFNSALNALSVVRSSDGSMHFKKSIFACELILFPRCLSLVVLCF